MVRLSLCGLAVTALLAGCGRNPPSSPAQRVEISNVSALRTAFGGPAVEAGPAAVAQIETPQGWATITGTFKIDGAPPTRAPLKIDKDLTVCAPGGKQVLSEEVVIDPATGGIKDVVLYLIGPHKKFPVGDPNWEHADYIAKQEAVPEFDQKNCVFLTHLFAMRSNQKLKILNSDPVGHNTNISGGGGAHPENLNVAANSYTYYSPGGESTEPFPVACNIHSWMAARMIVRDSPYVAVTKPDGTFEMANVPAGATLEFRVWQEKSKFIQKITLNGKATTWDKGKFKVKLEDGQKLALDVVVPAAAFNR